MTKNVIGAGDRCIQFIPAQAGWLALFEETTEDGIEIHAEPVIAWCLGARSFEGQGGSVALGQAVVGAGPWVEKADPEEITHFFALVREEQLDPEVLEELRANAHHSRAHLMSMAEQNRVERGQGHASWIRERRSMLRSVRLQRRAMVAS